METPSIKEIQLSQMIVEENIRDFKIIFYKYETKRATFTAKELRDTFSDFENLYNAWLRKQIELIVMLEDNGEDSSEEEELTNELEQLYYEILAQFKSLESERSTYLTPKPKAPPLPHYESPTPSLFTIPLSCYEIHDPKPEFEFPTFSGSKPEWKGFKKEFERVFVNNQQLEDTAKFLYLHNFVHGQAKHLIQGHSITDEGFRSAWKALCYRYDDIDLQPISSQPPFNSQVSKDDSHITEIVPPIKKTLAQMYKEIKPRKLKLASARSTQIEEQSMTKFNCKIIPHSTFYETNKVIKSEDVSSTHTNEKLSTAAKINAQEHFKKVSESRKGKKSSRNVKTISKRKEISENMLVGPEEPSHTFEVQNVKEQALNKERREIRFGNKNVVNNLNSESVKINSVKTLPCREARNILKNKESTLSSTEATSHSIHLEIGQANTLQKWTFVEKATTQFINGLENETTQFKSVKASGNSRNLTTLNETLVELSADEVYFTNLDNIRLGNFQTVEQRESSTKISSCRELIPNQVITEVKVHPQPEEGVFIFENEIGYIKTDKPLDGEEIEICGIE